MGGQSKPVFAVLGAGNGGMAMAGHLALKGFEVRLYNRTAERIEAVCTTGAIQVIGGDDESLPHGIGEVAMASTDIEHTLDGADIVMVVVPATGHRFIAEQCAPHLRDGQIVILHPGRTGGALEFYSIVRARKPGADVVIAEAQTLLYACRLMNLCQVRVFGMKRSVPLAALPAYRTPEVIDAIRPAFREFVPGDNVMKTSLDNIGAIDQLLAEEPALLCDSPVILTTVLRIDDNVR